MPKRGKVTEVTAGDHPVYLGSGALGALADRLSKELKEARVFVLVDHHTGQHCLPELMRVLGNEAFAGVLEVEAGEASKSMRTCQMVWEQLLRKEADRHAVLINLGGGVVTDLGGFVAGTYKRGIRCIHVPTTLMAMCDAAIGGKNGIDVGGVKNAVGLITGPLGVYVHVPFLRTLGKRELLNGVAEMLKHGLALDADHWQALLKAPLHDLDALTWLIERSVALKADVVSRDMHECGERKKLNFGHTVGHAIEAHSWESGQRALLHGEAVAMGMIAEAWLSWRRGTLPREDLDTLSTFIFSLYKPYPLMPADHHRLIALMRNDKKNRGEAILCTLLNGVGSAELDVAIKETRMSEALDHYRLLAAHHAQHHGL